MRKQRLKNRTRSEFDMRRMDSETYQLRRNVINIIYDIKRMGYDIPRIEVRIVQKREETNIMGYAYLNQNIVHIDQYWAGANKNRLVHLVLHEIVHAVTGFRHDDDCYLMNPIIPKKPDLELTWKAFDYYMKGYRR